MIMSFKYTNAFSPLSPVSTVFISRWKVAGAPFKPNGNSNNSKWPLSIENAVLLRWSGCIGCIGPNLALYSILTSPVDLGSLLC